jgi:hypothetical protein
MAFADRLVHDLTLVKRPVYSGETDDYGQPTPAPVTETAVRGLISPKSSREVPASNQAGAVIADHVAFLPIDIEVEGSDYLTFLAQRYDVVGIRSYRFGIAPHHELEVRLVSSPAPTVVPPPGP